MKRMVIITSPADRIEITTLDGTRLLELSVDKDSGKFIVDDHATGRVWEAGNATS